VLPLDEEQDIPSHHWIPKVHKCPYKQRYITGSANFSAKALSKLLTRVLIDKIHVFVIFGGGIFQHIVGIPMCTNLCTSSPRLVPLFVGERLHSVTSLK